MYALRYRWCGGQPGTNRPYWFMMIIFSTSFAGMPSNPPANCHDKTSYTSPLSYSSFRLFTRTPCHVALDDFLNFLVDVLIRFVIQRTTFAVTDNHVRDPQGICHRARHFTSKRAAVFKRHVLRSKVNASNLRISVHRKRGYVLSVLNNKRYSLPRTESKRRESARVRVTMT